MRRSSVGRNGESAAARYLEERGWRVVARNVRYREGEIDIVVERGGTLAIVEVKTRRTRTFGSPAEAVTPAKAARIRRLAIRYLSEHKPRAASIRFDVMEVMPEAAGVRIAHLEDAF